MIRLGIHGAEANVAAAGSKYSPDLVHDMIQRAVQGIEGTLRVAIATGYIDTGSVDEDVDDSDEGEEEVIESGPNIEWL